MASPDNKIENLAGLILAAGGSMRLGQPKQLVELNGRPLICRAVDAADSSCGAGVVVVTGDSALEVEAAIATLPAQVARNVDWQSGMAGSVATGLEALAGLYFDAVLIMLCDQAFVNQQDIARLAEVWRNLPTRLTAAFYGDKIGVPAIFPSTYLDRLSRLEGDRGAQALLHDDPEVSKVEMASAAFDVDTADDLRVLQDYEDR